MRVNRKITIPTRGFVRTLQRLGVVDLDLKDHSKNTAVHLWHVLREYWRVNH